MEDHFKGIVPEERWKNDVLNELREIRKLLGRDAQAIQPQQEKPERRKYTKRGASGDGDKLQHNDR